MKKCFVCFLVIIIGQVLYGQSIGRKVISTAGGYYDGPVYKVTYTVGETFTNTFTSNAIILNQGFQQPDSMSSVLNESLFLSIASRNLCGPISITSSSFVDVPVSVNSFSNMVSLQGSIKWDSTVLRYESISSFAPGIGLSSSAFNNPSANTLVFSWVDANLSGQTLADSSVLFTIRFIPAANAWSRSTTISFDNLPTPLEAVRNPATLLSVIPQAGSLRITARPVYDTTRLSGCGSVSYNGTTYTNSTTLNTLQSGTTGCDSISRTVIITVIPVPVVNPTSSNSPVLIGENLSLNVSGQNLIGGTFNWTGPNNFSSSLQNPVITATAAAAGQYRMIYTSTCRRDTQTLTVIVNAGISGRIISPLNQPISRVNLLRNNVPVSVNGSYNIVADPALPLVLKAAKNNDLNKVNGVSVIDIVLIQSHILQRSLLNQPYKIIAADVNRSATISSLDLVLIRRLILGLDTSFVGNRLWAFVDSSYSFASPANPFPYKDSFSYTSATLQTNRVNQTFIGMKLGDVNYDWNPQQLRPLPEQKELELYYDDIRTAPGAVIRVPVRMRNMDELLGMQFTLTFNPGNLRFLSASRKALPVQIADNRSAQGLLSFIWTDAQNQPKRLADGSVLVELEFEVTGSTATEQLQLSSAITPVEVWDGAYRRRNLKFGAGTISTGNGLPGWTVMPNPSRGDLRVETQLKEAVHSSLQLCNANGRVVWQMERQFPAGYSSWNVQITGVPAGMYLLRMPGVDGQWKKIVVVR
jgi:hypothetical protein